jgi:hypothetical protein
MGDVLVIVAVMWAGRRGGCTRQGAYPSTNRGTNTGTPAAPRDRTNYSPGAGADETAAQRSLGGIVRVGEGGRRQHKPGPDYAADSRKPAHLPNSQSTA